MLALLKPTCNLTGSCCHLLHDFSKSLVHVAVISITWGRGLSIISNELWFLRLEGTTSFRICVSCGSRLGPNILSASSRTRYLILPAWQLRTHDNADLTCPYTLEFSLRCAWLKPFLLSCTCLCLWNWGYMWCEGQAGMVLRNVASNLYLSVTRISNCESVEVSSLAIITSISGCSCFKKHNDKDSKFSAFDWCLYNLLNRSRHSFKIEKLTQWQFVFFSQLQQSSWCGYHILRPQTKTRNLYIKEIKHADWNIVSDGPGFFFHKNWIEKNPSSLFVPSTLGIPVTQIPMSFQFPGRVHLYSSTVKFRDEVFTINHLSSQLHDTVNSCWPSRLQSNQLQSNQHGNLDRQSSLFHSHEVQILKVLTWGSKASTCSALSAPPYMQTDR